MSASLSMALDENGVLVHVDDVPNGKLCNCTCPHCSSTLVAKNRGKNRDHHFAHSSGHECEGAYETALHLLAKEVLRETGMLMLPESEDKSFPSGLVVFKSVEIEKYDERYDIRPDADCVMENGERILVEFLVTHKVTGAKRRIIIDNNLRCVEIDLNYHSLDKECLKSFLINSSTDREWVKIVQQFTQKANTSGSSTSIRSAAYEKVASFIKEVFDTGTLLISPFGNSYYDLRKLGYDTCETKVKYHGFKSDLLLYRSLYNNKGYISINIRGRSRYYFKKPEELKVIDIIVGNVGISEMKKRAISENGRLKDDFGMRLNYDGFINKQNYNYENN